MQFIVNGDRHIDGRQAMSDLLGSALREALGQYEERITCVEAHLTDAQAASNGGLNDIHCILEARPAGLEPVVVKDRAGTAHQAMQGALRKLQRAIAGAFEKHDLRHTSRAVSLAGSFEARTPSASVGTS